MGLKTYTFDEAYQASLDYFTGDELAAKVWVNKYALKDAFGNIYEQTPTDMHRRLAGEVARVEAKYPNPLSEQELFELFDHFRFIIPQGSPMTGIGNDFQIASLSNCFVVGVEGNADSYGAVILSKTNATIAVRMNEQTAMETIAAFIPAIPAMNLMKKNIIITLNRMFQSPIHVSLKPNILP